LDSIEDGLDLHPVPFALIDGEFALPSSQTGGRMLHLPNCLKTISLVTNPLYFHPQIFLKSLILKGVESGGMGNGVYGREC